MKRTLIGWGLFGLTCYLLALLVTLPAARLAAWLGLPASEVRGSAWAGTATLAIAGERLHHLQWRLHPVWPWQGLLGARLSAQDQAGNWTPDCALAGAANWRCAMRCSPAPWMRPS